MCNRVIASHNGGKRADRLDAAAKGERLIGFEGNDVLRSGKGHDVLDGSQGSDTADFSRATGGVRVTLTSSDMQKIGGGLGQDRLLWIENLGGSAYKDRLEGDAGANRLDGGGGADTLIGGGGNDSYVVDRAQDRVVEAVGGGTDTVLARATWKLRAGVEVEVLRAADRGETRKLDLTGNGFGQRIEGNDGANRIEGGGGKDTVKGYDGADTFVLSSAPGPGNRLTVLDFDAAEDRFLLAHDAFGLPRGPLAASAFTANRAGLARDADDRIIHDTDSGRILFDTDGKGGAQAIVIAQIGASPTLGAADFLVG